MLPDDDVVLVLGGGPAGSMAALTLVRGGLACELVERNDVIPHRTCGDFLSTEAVQTLDALGFPWASAEASSVRRLKFQSRGRSATAKLPFEGRSVRRAFLDAWLLETARKNGVRIETGIRARSVVRDANLFRVDCGSRQYGTSTLILANGKHGLGGFHHRPIARRQLLVGWKMNFQHLGRSVAQALHETLCLFAFPGGYGGIARVADDTATVALLAQPALLAGPPPDRLGPLPTIAVEVPLLAHLLAESEPAWDRPTTVANLPYGHCDDHGEPGLFPVGDQFAVLPSFTGTGVSFAMASGAAAARQILRSPRRLAASRYADEARRLAKPVLRTAMPLHRLLQAPTFVRMAAHLLDAMPSVVSALARHTRLPDRPAFEEP